MTSATFGNLKIPGVTFYLGTQNPHWLAIAPVPLFISRRRLTGRKRLPAAECRWALDSGGFTELKTYGRWLTTPAEYAEDVLRFAAEIGGMDWAATQDWMCEPFMLEATGKSVREHQELSVRSFLDLDAMAPCIPWVPVLQGWHLDDYLAHFRMYLDAGLDLRRFHRVGVGSVCRRQGTAFATRLFRELHALGLRCHGFGLKTLGLRRCADFLESADSLAWSFRARRGPIRLDGCHHRNCSYCLRFALSWRDHVLDAIRATDREPTPCMP